LTAAFQQGLPTPPSNCSRASEARLPGSPADYGLPFRPPRPLSVRQTTFPFVLDRERPIASPVLPASPASELCSPCESVRARRVAPVARPLLDSFPLQRPTHSSSESSDPPRRTRRRTRNPLFPRRPPACASDHRLNAHPKANAQAQTGDPQDRSPRCQVQLRVEERSAARQLPGPFPCGVGPDRAASRRRLLLP
jgi:hypothetical protein